MKVNGHDQSTRAYVGAFNFKGQDQQKNVGKLSGGERNRVNIAKMLKRGGNVLLLDEPTNDLDVETLGALEEAIENFAGCAVVISHDRFFLDRLATHILAEEADADAAVDDHLALVGMLLAGDHPEERRLAGAIGADHTDDAARRKREGHAVHEQPDSGEIKIGPTVHLGYVDQSRDALRPNKNVWEEISDGSDVFRFGKHEIGTRAYVGAFNFRGPDQQKKVGQLSGGERNRVH
jgi:ATPase subunit of ABC transporter with duplicated ATPase domains